MDAGRDGRALIVFCGSLLRLSLAGTLQMSGFAVQKMEFDAEQVKIRLIEHFTLGRSEPAQQLSSVNNEVADGPANIHDSEPSGPKTTI